jgi:2-amino-4-hydroxy-6-hydroxymethyldihydropteridine diphosphokinase
MKNSLVHQAWIGLGSNQGDRKVHLLQAQRQMTSYCGKILRVSGIYESDAWGFDSQHMFYNQCLQLETKLSPDVLLQKLLQIEEGMDRKRNDNGYADRPIDLDILFYNDRIIQAEDLQVPHPRITERRFVLQPLHEIAPDKKDPLTGLTVAEQLERCKDSSRVVKIFP